MTIFCQFLNIVYQAKELPLASHLSFSPQAKAVQSFIGADIAEYWFNHGHAMSIVGPSLLSDYAYAMYATDQNARQASYF